MFRARRSLRCPYMHPCSISRLELRHRHGDLERSWLISTRSHWIHLPCMRLACTLQRTSHKLVPATIAILFPWNGTGHLLRPHLPVKLSQRCSCPSNLSLQSPCPETANHDYRGSVLAHRFWAVLTSVVLRVPSVHADLTKDSFDGLQLWADVVAKVMERTSASPSTSFVNQSSQ